MSLKKEVRRLADDLLRKRVHERGRRCGSCTVSTWLDMSNSCNKHRSIN